MWNPIHRVRVGLVEALKQGWTRNKILWSLSAGLCIGLFPIFGVTTASCLLVGHGFRLNHGLMQAMNYLVAPLKVALIFPFLRLGERLFAVEQGLELSLAQLLAAFQAEPLGMLRDFTWSFVHATMGWLVLAPFILLGLRLISGAALAVYRPSGKACRAKPLAQF